MQMFLQVPKQEIITGVGLGLQGGWLISAALLLSKSQHSWKPKKKKKTD
jgi:hypothetical protein